jgi:hypothetical protein
MSTAQELGQRQGQPGDQGFVQGDTGDPQR